MNTLPSVQNLTDAANANIGTFQSFAEIVLNASERLTTLNIDAARSLFALASANSAPLFGEGIRDQIAGRMSMQSQGMEKAAEYVRNVNDVLLRSQADVTQLGAKRMNEMTESLHAMLDSLAKTGPAGSADIVAAMKTALTTANTTFENMIRTAREVTETNLAAAASALQSTVHEASIATKASKRAA